MNLTGKLQNLIRANRERLQSIGQKVKVYFRRSIAFGEKWFFRGETMYDITDNTLFCQKQSQYSKNFARHRLARYTFPEKLNSSKKFGILLSYGELR